MVVDGGAATGVETATARLTGGGRLMLDVAGLVLGNDDELE